MTSTPQWERFVKEQTSGSLENAKKLLCSTQDTDHNELILVKNINFYSVCEHHLLPFFGTAHIAYIPNKKIVGISKITDVVDELSKRKQVQETLTTDIAQCLLSIDPKPKGVAVVIKARHLCMEMTGNKQPGTEFVTSALRGLFKEQDKTRQEFFSLIQ